MNKPNRAACVISVIIPCFNDAKNLPRSVKSILAQDVPGTEIIIVDDCSTDDSWAVAQSLAQEFPAIRVMQQSVNSGCGPARNTGLRHAAGRYVAFLDSDDEYAPGFLAATVPQLEEEPEIAWIVANVEVVNSHREIHPVQIEAMVRSLVNNIVVRKAAADLIGGFPEDPFFRGKSGGEDIMFREALRRWFKGAYRPEKFLRYYAKRGSYFDHFLDNSTVQGNQLVFADVPAPEKEERFGSLRRFNAQVQERMDVLGALTNSQEAAPSFVERLFKATTDFDQLRTALAAVDGSLHPQEGFALYHFARYGPAQGAIVEIGNPMGRATCWLATGTRSAQREKVLCMEQAWGPSEHQNGSPAAAVAPKGPAFAKVLAHMQKHGLVTWIEARAGSSAEVGQWHWPIRLLFLGGDHSYEAKRAGVTAWGNFLVPSGIMAIPDVHVWPGVTEYYQELLQANHLWMEVAKVRGMRYVQRIA